MKFKIHNLSVWNQNKEIYKYLFQEYDPDQKYFSTFDYDLIQHTNLDNFFFEIKNNYKVQYLQIKNLIKHFNYDLHKKYTSGDMSPKQLITYNLIQEREGEEWISPWAFNQLVLQIQIQLKPGDLVDLKQNTGLGLYLVYPNPDSGDIIYIHKTKDLYGINLPSQAWKFIEKYGWCYGGVPIGGCYLPRNAKVKYDVDVVNDLNKKLKHGFLVFVPQQYLECPRESKNIKLMTRSTWAVLWKWDPIGNNYLSFHK